MSGGGDSSAACLCALCTRCLSNKIVINHNLRYESACEPMRTCAFVCSFNSAGASASLRRCRLLLLIKLMRKLGCWHLCTAHTLNDSTEHALGRQIGGVAYSLGIPSLRQMFGISLSKPWVVCDVRAFARSRYVNDVMNADANSLRTLWRQLQERMFARCQWGLFASARLSSVLC
ncbi:MAG: ATP-binding protein [Candidatus Hodgkinia cicadicola]